MKAFLYITIISIQVIFFNITVFSQSNSNETKYWVWRDRLINDFMVPGKNTGCGIIINTRGYFKDYNGYYGGFDISDEGFQMGKYLIVLASEWKLLTNGGYSTEKTELELYYELKTIDRLDVMADFYWYEHWGGTVYPTNNANGFMIRDDVFENFLSENPSTFGQEAYNNFLYLNQGGNCGKYYKLSILPKKLWSDDYLSLTDYQQAYNLHGSEWGSNSFSGAVAGIYASQNYGWVTGPEEDSQDNYIGLLQGLVAIVHFLPDNIVVSDPENCDEPLNIKLHAQEIIDRIIHFIYESKGDNFGHNSGSTYYHQSNDWQPGNYWLITNPITGMCVKGVNWKDYFENLANHHWWDPIPMNDCCNLGGAESGPFSWDFWHIHNNYSGTTGVIDHWDIGRSLPPNPDNLWAILSTLDNENSKQEVCSWVNNFSLNEKYKYIYLDLLSCVLYGGTPCRGDGYYNWFLGQSPCGTIWDESDLNNNSGDNFLSQMVVFNLLKLAQNSSASYSFPQNYSFAVTDDNPHYPYMQFGTNDAGGSTPGPIIGTNDQQHFDWFGQDYIWDYKPKFLYSENVIISNSQIGNYLWSIESRFSYKGYVNYIAGESINLGQGFKVTDSAYFDAKIDANCQCKIRQGIFDYLVPCSSKSFKFVNHNQLYSIDSLHKIICFPNPTTGQFAIVSSDRSLTFVAKVFDVTGKQIFNNESTNGIIKFDLTDEPIGLYAVVIKDSKDEEYFLKIIHQ